MESPCRARSLTHPVTRLGTSPAPLVIPRCDGGGGVVFLSRDQLTDAGETAEAAPLEGASHTPVQSWAPLVGDLLHHLCPLLNCHHGWIAHCWVADLASYEHVEYFEAPQTTEQPEEPGNQHEFAKVALHEVDCFLEESKVFAKVYERVVLVVGGWRWTSVCFIPTLHQKKHNIVCVWVWVIFLLTAQPQCP